ncbi:hypothetical protein PRIPAC_74020 [Pristionchus pacificus]|uniref:Uncharacterized protein n=1 Tax=Pristionchus pacificus TaxID=54126 RepID=A0A2A6CSR0_PRIPA|nr:hypothetical protein PRIPAC_74020 [Pristionchus pacificus]|eukprot:PDM81107.1 hypothetical protein PRIPAC_36110 [Pristionchus pacificus]
MMMPLDDFIYMILNFVFAFGYLTLIIILQTSREKYHHNTFFCIFKVTGFYGVINLTSSIDFHICFTSRDLYILKRVISARKLYLIFVFQFILSFLAMSPNLFASVLITIVASAYCSYFVFSAFLTTQTMRRMRETPESVRQRINARQLSLVRYTIYCSIAQFLKGVILFLRVSTYIWDTDKFLLNLANAMFYPINIFTVSSTFWLLIIFSNSVRRGLRMVFCRSTAAPATISTASRDNDGRRYSLSQH